ncbi:36170_t:CDS:2, partial [Gigaspora margarita]
KYGNAKAITYLGPTFIRICSGKHDTSTTYIHSKDFNDLISDERLYNFTTTKDENTIIDGYPVLVEYVDPKEHYQLRLDEKSVAWIERHTMTCHYITQFFLPPILVQQKSHSICAASINASDDTTHFSNFLLSTPTINKSINKYLCSFCYQYFGLKKSLKRHIQKCPYKSSNSLTDNQDFQDTDHLVNDKGEAMWIEEDTIPEDALESLF